MRIIRMLAIIIFFAPLVASAQSAAKPKSVEVNDSSTMIYDSVDVPAKFPGADGQWVKFLERNMQRDIVVENGAPAGCYTAVVSFLVNTEGRISDIKIESNPGYGLAEEAVRLMKKGPRWVPAMKVGKAVASRQKQSFISDVTIE